VALEVDGGDGVVDGGPVETRAKKVRFSRTVRSSYTLAACVW